MDYRGERLDDIVSCSCGKWSGAVYRREVDCEGRGREELLHNFRRFVAEHRGEEGRWKW